MLARQTVQLGILSLMNAAIAAPVFAGPISPLSQNRQITCDSNVFGPGGHQDLETGQAADFAPYVQSLQSNASTANATSIVEISHDSTIDACGVNAACNLTASAIGNGFHAYSVGVTTCSVTFSIGQASAFRIAGFAQADALSQVKAVLHQGSTSIVNRTIVNQATAIWHRGSLPPGTYTIFFQGVATSAEQDGRLVGASAFDLKFTTCPNFADINVDGKVNVDDLLAIINAWGTCPQPCDGTCPPDVNGDCSVNVDDLLAVLNDWS